MPRLWPSTTLARYTAKLFLLRILAFALVLIGILQVLDVLTESNAILAAEGNGNAELLRYAKLRLPQLVNQFLPFSVLLATLVTLGGLAQASEIVIMKGAGISAHAILAPLMVTALGVALVHFAFAQTVLPRTNAELNAWQQADYARGIETDAEQRFDIWARGRDGMLHAGRAEIVDGGVRLYDVTAYRLDGADLTAIVEAEEALPAGDGWRTIGARRFSVAENRTDEPEGLRVGGGVPPSRFTSTVPDPDEVGSFALGDAIDRLREAGRPVETLATAWHRKFSAPLSTVLMPLLGAVTGFGLARSGRLFVRSVVGLALGFAYFVADNLMAAMGNLGTVPPVLAAWAPFLLFLLVGEAVLFRTEE